MQHLTVDHYFSHKNDMQIFLTLGSLLAADSPWHTQPEENSTHWIPFLVHLLKTRLPGYMDEERLVSTRLFTTTILSLASCSKWAGIRNNGI